MRKPVGTALPHLSRVLFAFARCDAARPATQGHVGAPAAQLAGRTVGGLALSVVVPIRTISAANAREHWAVKAKRVRAERQTTAWALAQAGRTPAQRAELVTRCPVVRLTRLMGPRGRELDDDNLCSALKGLRDEVALWLGADDADKRIAWVYAEQQRADDWGVRVEVFA
jgi:hypothetical protein